MAKAMRRHAHEPDGNRTEEWFGPDGNHLTLYVRDHLTLVSLGLSIRSYFCMASFLDSALG